MALHNADTHSPLVRRADQPADYQRLGIDPSTIEAFEDVLRTDPQRRGVYEWWYFDCHLDNGAKVVITFATKNPSNPMTRLSPFMTINVDLPDGRSLSRSMTAEPDVFSAATDHCDVRIGDNRFTGDLHHYRIHATIDEITIDAELNGEVAPWRPATGHALFGTPQHEKYFAWLPSVPSGTVEVACRVGEETFTSSGVGYHDHNWGDAPMMKLMHDWYWGRAIVGDYTLIAAYVTGEKKYDYGSQTSFLLTHKGQIIAQDANLVTFTTDKVSTDQETGKPVADILTYTYDDGSTRYEARFERRETIFRTRFADNLPPVAKALATLEHFDGCYLRFVGTLTLTTYQDGQQVEQVTEDKALWELMYFSHPRTPAA